MNGPDTHSSGAAQAFAEGGPVGELLSGVDWEATPLGPAERWPTRLVETLRVMLSAEQPMALCWGSDFVMLYNEGYATVIGSKHPGALGAPIGEVFPENWNDTTKPLFNSVADERKALLLSDRPFLLERHGYLEQSYFDIAFQPVLMDDGTVGGLLCIVTETTGRVLSERRLRLLTELGNRTAGLPTPGEVARTASEVLAGYPDDVPFARILLTSGAGSLGDEPLGAAGDRLAAVVRDGTPATLPAGSFRDSGTPGPGPGTDEVLALPLILSGRVEAVLVAGVNRLLPLAGAYRGFFDVLAAGITGALTTALAQQEQRRRAESLAELDRAKTAFFSNVSHEFRTPLTLFLGPVQEALAEEDRSEQRERLELAERNALRLLKLVNTLLDVSRAEAGRLSATYEPVDLSRTTAELAGVFLSAYDAAGLGLEVDCPPLPEPVYIDLEMWEKIVLNLLSNALKFTFDGGVRLRTSAVGDRARLTVTDTGTGIPEDEIPHLFERFHQVRGARSRSHEGSGIGLALVRDLVELHGGTVSVDSRPGAGSEFTVEIPFGSAHLVPKRVREREPEAGSAGDSSGRVGAYADEALRWVGADDPAAATATPPGPGLSSADQPCRPRLLVADDNADMRSYLGKLLRPEHDVLLVPDGRDALNRALETPVDMVITDAMMPHLDGFELVRALRADPRTARLPIVMLTARAGEEASVQGLHAGADDYLSKPFSARQLLARVRANLELSRLRERVLADSRRHVAMLTSLSEAGLRLSGTLEPRQVLESAVDVLLPGLADQVRIRLTEAGAPVPPVFTSGKTVFPDRVLARAVGAALGEPDDAEGGPTPETLLAVPLRSHGRTLGAVAVARQDNAYTEAERKYLEALTSRIATAYDNATRYQNERRLALTLQHALLPRHLPQAPGLRTASYYRASATGTEIGGDWYDVIPLPGGGVGLAIGDVMGHDMDAATVMGRLCPALHGYALDGAGPGEVLYKLDAYLHSLDVEHFATCLYAVYEPGSHRLRYACAGHLPPLVVAGSDTRFLEAGQALPLGLEGCEPVDHEAVLSPGTGLLFYTDGLVENRALSLDDGLEKLHRLCGTLSVQDLADPQRVIDRALGLLDTPGRVEDDTALLAAAVGRFATDGRR